MGNEKVGLGRGGMTELPLIGGKRHKAKIPRAPPPPGPNDEGKEEGEDEVSK